jgi:TRAP transporter TAXI family solute receptor
VSEGVRRWAGSRRRALLLGLVGAGAAAGGGTAAVLAGRRSGPAGAPAELRIATGPPGAVFKEFGAALAEVLAERFPETRVRAIPTGASVENLALLANGGTDLAFASLDATVAGLADGVPQQVTAVARLYDSWVQLLVRAESPIQTLKDLAGKRLASGADGSGTRFTLQRLLALATIEPQLITATQDVGAAMLAAGQVAAMATLTGVPTPAVKTLAEKTSVRMIALEEYVEPMIQHYGEQYTAATVPSSAYPGVSATPTLTTPNLLLARPDLPASVVEVVAETLFAERARIARGHPEANRINVRTGIATGSVPLHPGAVRYFRSAKA